MDNEIVEKVLLAHVEEQRRARRWGNVWRAASFGVLVLILSLSFWDPMGSSRLHPTSRHTALVDLSGVIDQDGGASADVMNESLREAFKNTHAAGIILRINSPGGSPVQSGMIFDEVRRLKALHKDKPVVAVVADVAASGGYYVAAAADSIYVDKASLVGSIGVRMDGFGFTEAMKKLGVERRVLTAGENKALLDPFLPVDPKQKTAVQSMLSEVHQQFIEAVKHGRGDRLKPTADMFSGMVWTGAKSVELGLADGLGTVDSVARDVIKAEEVVDYTLQPNLAERLAKRFGAAAGDAMAKVMLRWGMH
ncbi:MAG: S49 family peptidase [Burkholderiaceae bacterium]